MFRDSNRRWQMACAALLTICISEPAAGEISIDIGSVTVTPGGSAVFAVTLLTGGAEVAGTQNVIQFAAPIAIATRVDGQPDCTVEPRIDKAATSFRFQPLGCTADRCTGVRAFVLSFDNSDPIADDTVLYRCRVRASATASVGDYPLRNGQLAASDSRGGLLTAAGSDGYVHVRGNSISVDVGDTEILAGPPATVDVRLRSGGAAVAGVQNRIDYAAPLHVAARENGTPDCTVNAAIDKPATSFRFLPVGCVATQCTGLRAVVLAFENVTPIPDGAVVYRCRITADAGATVGVLPLRNSEAAGTDPNGVLLPATGRDGMVDVFLDDSPVAIATDTVAAVSGQRTLVAVRLDDLDPADGIDAAGTQNEIVFDSVAPIGAREDGSPDCVANPDLHKDATDFLFLPLGCIPAIDCERVRAFVLALDNTDPIPDGSVLYRCAVQVSASAALGTYPLRIENAVASDSRGQPVAARNRSGAVEVICAGDCDGNGQVAIFELLRGVNILLGDTAAAACPRFDADRSGEVDVNEVVQAVSSALRGCNLQ